MKNKAIYTAQSLQMHRVINGQKERRDEWLASEVPLEIRLSSDTNLVRQTIQYMITMRTPGHDEDLATGLLYCEGIIESKEQIISIERLDPNVIELQLRGSANFDFRKYKQRDLVTSSCGICGKSSLDAVDFNSQRLAWSSKIKVDSNLILSLPQRMRTCQSQFEITGGVHAAGLFDSDGNLEAIREDIGRHNALDKLAGAIFEKDLSQNILLVSGRTSYELVQKTAMLGVPILVSIGPASSMAVEVATLEGITLVGFLKESKYNIYSGAERITI